MSSFANLFHVITFWIVGAAEEIPIFAAFLYKITCLTLRTFFNDFCLLFVTEKRGFWTTYGRKKEQILLSFGTFWKKMVSVLQFSFFLVYVFIHQAVVAVVFSLQKYNQFADYLIPHKQNVNPYVENMPSGWDCCFLRKDIRFI